MNKPAGALQIDINGLSSRDTPVLEFAASFGFTCQELAAALDIDVSHARVPLHRARCRHRRELVASYENAVT
jgi:DNA-directed RNA polymerase specialized sigma24 family protein